MTTCHCCDPLRVLVCAEHVWGLAVANRARAPTLTSLSNNMHPLPRVRVCTHTLGSAKKKRMWAVREFVTIFLRAFGQDFVRSWTTDRTSPIRRAVSLCSPCGTAEYSGVLEFHPICPKALQIPIGSADPRKGKLINGVINFVTGSKLSESCAAPDRYRCMMMILHVGIWCPPRSLLHSSQPHTLIRTHSDGKEWVDICLTHDDVFGVG